MLCVVQERPGEKHSEAGCPPCPGPNLSKWRDTELRAEAEDEHQASLAFRSPNSSVSMHLNDAFWMHFKPQVGYFSRI